MKDRPILFSAPMVRAILEGRKTQTRRIIKPQPVIGPGGSAIIDGKSVRFYIGDRLWVRETWKFSDWTEDGEPWIEYQAGGRLLGEPDYDWSDRVQDIWATLSSKTSQGPACDRNWRSPIYMPRWASRITLEVTGLRVERVQDISEADAVAEGVTGRFGGLDGEAAGAVEVYRELWEQINGVESWTENPWVWVVEFRQVQP